jgi:hypothetical protein
MNLISFKSEGPIVGHDDKFNTGIIGRRWAMVARRWYVGFESQHRYKNYEWSAAAGEYYIAGFMTSLRDWGFGYSKAQYDGFHCALWFGPFYISWSQ